MAIGDRVRVGFGSGIERQHWCGYRSAHKGRQAVIEGFARDGD